ncbi:MAG: hypothetical protein JNG83_15230 [Opitutaceae bacterium]|nr:hypothetical protein [Opitutaceae bacterium]
MSDSYHDGEPLRIGTGHQLLLDDALVEDRWRLTRRLVRPEKYIGNPVLARNKPWEGGLVAGPQVMWDPALGKYRMWYNCAKFVMDTGDDLPRKCVAYAESDDGFEWVKPRLDLVPSRTYGPTNVIFTGSCPEDEGRHGAMSDQVIRDEADPDPARRYKMVTYLARFIDGKVRRGVSLAVSPDGLRWTLDGDRHILDYNSDTLNLMVHDPARGRWLLYCRPRSMHATGRQPQEPVPGFYPQGRHSSRRIAVMTTRDFRTWSYPRTCLYPGEGEVADYDAFSVFRCGSHFLMLYVAMDGDGPTATKNVHLASSVDGVRWERFHTGEPFIPRGREGDWDAGQIMRVSTLGPVVHGPNLLFYYQGCSKGQYEWSGQSGVGIAMAQANRFAMQWADDEPAYLITKEFLLEGNRLRVNSIHFRQARQTRSLRVEVLRHPPLGGHAGFAPAYPGFSLAECGGLKGKANDLNGSDALVAWNGSPDLSPLQGRPVYLRFELRNMGLFSFRTPVE